MEWKEEQVMPTENSFSPAGKGEAQIFRVGIRLRSALCLNRPSLSEDMSGPGRGQSLGTDNAGRQVA